MIYIYEHCWRGHTDCMAINCIPGGVPEDIGMEDFHQHNYTPKSFVCCGLHDGSNDPDCPDQDIYRLCFKNAVVDEITHNDMQDLTSIMAVISSAMNFDAVMKVNEGVVEIPAINEK